MLGYGYTDKLLTPDEVSDIAARAVDSNEFDGKRVLLIVPDHTRTAPMPLMYQTLYGLLGERVAALDVIIALGTHPPMEMSRIYRLLGITAEEHQRKYPNSKFYNHLWKDPSSLTVVGELSEEKTAEITEGRLRLRVAIPINKMALEYDHLIIIGPVFPHEVAGFSGGHKYLFPGIAGQEILDFFHWLGALITNPAIIGVKNTPVRAVIEEAASHVATSRSCFAMVVKHERLAGLYYGSVREAWETAADLSDKLHIEYKEKPYHTVLSCAPRMYDDIWTAGKCMYKLEPVVADGGKLIIYAPHVSEISYTHGHILDQIGYHTRDYFVRDWDNYKHYPWGVLAHSTHVKGIGSFQDGRESPRVEVILATQIAEERCRRVNLGYLDPSDVLVEDYKGKEKEGILYVPKAGETLFRLSGR